MAVENIPFALRSQPRSRLAKLILIAIVADTDTAPGHDDYVPCLTSLDRLAIAGMCESAEVRDELEALRAGGFLAYLAVYDDGSVVAEAVQPEIITFGDGRCQP